MTHTAKTCAIGASFIYLMLACMPAFAAKIVLTSCIDKEVKVCSFDSKQLWNAIPTVAYNLSKNKTVNYQCHANCAFLISKPNDSKCWNGGNWINHSWGAGNYLLVGLEKSENGQYKSSNLQNGIKCPSAP